MLKVTIKLDINENLYLKNPEETELGRRIVENGILLIDEIGFESFTFKKLAEKISSTEASIYRYFENKHLLFIYLVNWYWEWMKFRVGFYTMNESGPVEKLKAAIRVIVDTSQRSTSVDYVDTEVLHRIVVTEGTKAYHKKNVDEENKEGFFLSYKALCGKLADIILEVKPGFSYSRSLASMLIETANNNIYFARHLPRLTDIRYKAGFLDEVVRMLYTFALGCIHGEGS
ncbi:MAG: TetR/AcrR family transcriptional regulator [Phaeodactylibacter sp.]|nr:TetR/AcrR family transcriptional regulator [Phaeodactylibacter sp.]MCB9267592.1 TetR/AcrR family transcriptional regulator [Lewinellaceae bacterium]MCB9287921.1 TetR/AcrR family transcriptional regulator [Lewinellaceae bacterium]